MKTVKIYGERCSGTNYLAELLELNFEVNMLPVTADCKYGHKHFFGFQDLSDSDDVLFIGIVRNPVKWINSLYRVPHSVKHENILSVQRFLYNEHVSYIKNPLFKTRKPMVFNQGEEIMEDRNIYTGKRYRNLMELRHTKLRFFVEDMPDRVSQYILVRYEDFMSDFEGELRKIQAFGLSPRQNQLVNLDKKPIKPWMNMGKDSDEIPAEMVFNHPDFNPQYEKHLGYID
jgi:hypothetical protein